MCARAPSLWSRARLFWRRSPSRFLSGRPLAQNPLATGGLPGSVPHLPRPALALLLAVAGYQNLVTYPGLRSELRRPQVLPAVSVNVGTWAGGGTPTSIPEGQGLLLYVRIPPDGVYMRYTAELFSPAGKREGSFTITPTAGQDQWPVTVPGIDREAGTYTMSVRGVTAGGETKDLGSTSFQLQIQR